MYGGTPLSIRTEIMEAVEASANLFANGGSLVFEAYQVAAEWTDVVAVIVASFDETNRDEDAARVKAELGLAIVQLQSRVSLPFWATGLLPLLGPLLVDQLVAYTGPVEQFKRERLLPFFHIVEQVGKRGREMLQQLPPPPTPPATPALKAA